MSRSANYKSNALIFGLSESKICSANVPDVCQVWFLAFFPGLLIAHDTKRPHSRNCLITDVITVSLPYLLFKNSSVWILRRTGNPLAEQVFLTLPPSHCLNHFSWCSGHAWTCPCAPFVLWDLDIHACDRVTMGFTTKFIICIVSNRLRYIRS